MKLSIVFVLSSFLFFTCNNNVNKNIDDLVEINDKGVQEVKAEELSVEDVNRLINSADNAQSYTAILNNDIEKTYTFSTDSNQTVICKLNSKSPVAKVFLYKEMIKVVKRDSTTKVKINELSLIKSGDSISDYSKKPTKYKAVVKLERKFATNDSTAEFTLKVFKK